MSVIKRGIIRFVCGLADVHDHQFHLKVPVEHIFPNYDMKRKWFDVVLTDKNRKVISIFNIVSHSYDHHEELRDLIRAVDEDGYPIMIHTYAYDSRHDDVQFSPDVIFAIGSRLFKFPDKYHRNFWKSFDPDGYDYEKHEIKVDD